MSAYGNEQGGGASGKGVRKTYDFVPGNDHILVLGGAKVTDPNAIVTLVAPSTFCNMYRAGFLEGAALDKAKKTC